jgi:hypothetical protein
MPPTMNITSMLETMKPTWDATEHAMSWFTRLVTTAYAWSDIIVRMRQNTANKEWKKKKAEETALQIMKDHQEKLVAAGRKRVEKRAESMVKFVIADEEGGPGSEMEEFVNWVEQQMDLFMD